MQAIAMENNLAETAFFVPVGEGEWRLRWFTPTVEVDLCGHATLAAAHVLFAHLGYAGKEIAFHTRSGRLAVARLSEGRYRMDFPEDVPGPLEASPEQLERLARGLGAVPAEVLRGVSDWLAVLGDEGQVRALRPDFRLLAGIPARGIIATAPGLQADFVSRFFAPQSGIDEDPVTGSAHTTLAPFWALRLGKKALSARQVSARGGELHCVWEGGRVLLEGRAVTTVLGHFLL
jgi:PhzF family phenazine biosynthesis protein